MIVSRPKFSALFALGMFILASFSIGGYNLSRIISAEGWWLNYTLSILFLPLGIAILIRQMWSYKIVKMDRNKLIIEYPIRFNKKSFVLKELEYWQETVIKTVNGQFKQVDLAFNQTKVTLAMQENTNYSKIVSYLSQKLAGKKIK